MMSNTLEYKGYIAKVEYSAEDHVLFGKIEGIRDLVNFESETATGIEEEFHAAVDDYLALCEETGKEPNKSYSGTFNVRISTELHRKIAMLAIKNGSTLNAEVEKAISEHIYSADSYMKDAYLSIYNGTKAFAKMYDASGTWHSANIKSMGGRCHA